tara:strand:- start:570 stop:1775 length:1206 start_codon:yes stop_codon:yes gene_type:complete
MAIDKSLSQYQQNLLRGTTLDALRKAGITDAPIQNYATPRITVQAPKVQNISLPESQASMPATKIKAASPITRLLGESPGGAGLGSFDSKRYNALARSFFDQATKQAMDDPNLKYVSKFLNRPYGPRTVADKGVSIIGDPGVDAEENQPQDVTVETSMPDAVTGENLFQSFNDNEMQSAFSSGNQNTQNLITNLVNDGTNIFNNNPLLITALKTGGESFAKNKVGGVLANELGLAGVGAVGGLPGMALGWLVGKAFDFFRGKGKDANKLPENVFGLPLTNTDIKDDDKIDDVDLTDEGFTVSGTYGDNEVYSSDGSSVDSETGDITNADGTYGGNIVDEFVSTPAPTPTYTPPSPVIDSGNGDSGGGWSGSGGRSDDSWSSSPFNKGGRVDKALTGRRRDI